MCGIIGYAGEGEVASRLLDGLGVLEYRGYDSAGLALGVDRDLLVRRAVGPVSALAATLPEERPAALAGIGHTRWATHGRVTLENAHPLCGCDGRLAIVLNGIVENFAELREGLCGDGHLFSSETDAETIVHLIEDAYRGDLAAAVGAVTPRLRGHFAFAAYHAAEPGRLIATRRACPLVLGRGEEGNYLASMSAAFSGRAGELLLLEDGELASLDATGIEIHGAAGVLVERDPVPAGAESRSERGEYPSFMAKEIAEQPAALRATLRGRIGADGMPTLVELDDALLRGVREVVLLACGSAYHAALYGGRLLEEWAELPCRVEIASEWRYRARRLAPGTLVVCVSQSGETADTLAAQAHAAALGADTVAVCNVAESQLVRQTDATLLTQAGMEVGVAATKTFSTQVIALAALALELAARHGSLAEREIAARGHELRQIPTLFERFFDGDHPTLEVADRVAEQPFFLYLGRDLGLPIALEGALKLKEISYIPTDAYAAGEMKHGPIALLSEQTPVVCVATDGPVYEKLVSNILEVRARGASVIAIASDGNERLQHYADEVIFVPTASAELGPLLCVPALQLLALRIAERRGLDADRPRNLAKTVTVE
jgi:glucosamine--fructose-6-phosphate aminotransferase (isomerizing)